MPTYFVNSHAGNWDRREQIEKTISNMMSLVLEIPNVNSVHFTKKQEKHSNYYNIEIIVRFNIDKLATMNLIMDELLKSTFDIVPFVKDMFNRTILEEILREEKSNDIPKT